MNFELNPFTLILKKSREFHEDLIIYVYILFCLILIYNLFGFLLDKFFPVKKNSSIYHRRKIIRYLTVIFGILAIIPIFYERIAYLPTLIAFTGAAFVISTKDITLNFIGWVLIHSRNGFSVGDRIEIGHNQGEVINIGLMRFTLLEVNHLESSGLSTNRFIHVPNHLSITNQYFVVSKDLDLIWDEILIYLDVKSDWIKAKQICLDILKKNSNQEKIDAKLNEELTEVSKDFLVKIGKTTPIVFLSLDESKIVLNLRYLSFVHQRRNNRDKIFTSILESFDKEKKIKFYSNKE